MPGGDGTGPRSQGSGIGRGIGRGRRQGGNFGIGPGGYCVCPNCGKKEPHKTGVPCLEMKCPNCGTNMVRE